MSLFNEAEASADAETEELLKRGHPLINVKRKRKKEETFPILRPLRPGPINWKGSPLLSGMRKKKYNVVTKEP